MNIEIKNKTAVVTGANRGIGRSITEIFLQAGAKKVYLAVRDLDSVKELEEKYGNRVAAVQVDVADKAAIQNLAKQTPDAEIVVNNAGVLKQADANDPNAEEALAYEFNINTLGLLRMAQAYQPILKKQPEAAFVQLNSVASIKNFASFTTYSASKAAAYSLTQGLRETWANDGIQVLSVHPGPIATDMAKQAGFDEADPADVVADGIVESLATGAFHVFPDTMAKQFEAVYHDYATQVIEAEPEG
ncbi:SDR family oxidoreductase [Marinicella sp. S1101]|uniref:SDR family oxidoreductase n=1 Tax=Marinicella marina TaxID=2996016 RepID=UPI002260A813|nr:SDR family oxidoreductase [Marinicella marina]MCX7552554.1 SDR family oxidoreductase [Marinicella marina]MDJ1139430.1 SDR family oxidoreductase [Marinicella marina]